LQVEHHRDLTIERNGGGEGPLHPHRPFLGLPVRAVDADAVGAGGHELLE
jgi:hypothetical protein